MASLTTTFDFYVLPIIVPLIRATTVQLLFKRRCPRETALLRTVGQDAQQNDLNAKRACYTRNGPVRPAIDLDQRRFGALSRPASACLYSIPGRAQPISLKNDHKQ
jgi:hypothetical protein